MLPLSSDFNLSKAHQILSELSSLEGKNEPTLYVYDDTVSTERTTIQSVTNIIVSINTNLENLPVLLKKISVISKENLSTTDKPLESMEIEGAIRGLNTLLPKLSTKDQGFVEQAIKNLRGVLDQLKQIKGSQSTIESTVVEPLKIEMEKITLSRDTEAVLQGIEKFTQNYVYLDKDVIELLALTLENKLTNENDESLHKAFFEFLDACIVTRQANLKLLNTNKTPVFDSEENRSLMMKMTLLHRLLTSEVTDPKIVAKFKTLIDALAQTATIFNTQFDTDNFISGAYPPKMLEQILNETTSPLYRYKELLDGNPSKIQKIKKSITTESDFNVILKDIEALTLLSHGYGFYNPFYIKSEWTNVDRTTEGCFVKGNRSFSIANQFGKFSHISVPLDLSTLGKLDLKQVEQVMNYINSYKYEPTSLLSNLISPSRLAQIDFLDTEKKRSALVLLANSFQKELQGEIYNSILSLSDPTLPERESSSIFSTLGNYTLMPFSMLGNLAYIPYSIAKSYILGSGDKHELKINLQLEDRLSLQSDAIKAALKAMQQKDMTFVTKIMNNSNYFIDYLLDDSKDIYHDGVKQKLRDRIEKSPDLHSLFLQYFKRILDLKPEVIEELTLAKENVFPGQHLDDKVLQELKMKLVTAFSDDPELVNFVMHLDAIVFKHYQQVSWGYLTELQKERHQRATLMRRGEYQGESELSPLSKIEGMKIIKDLLQNLNLKGLEGGPFDQLSVDKIGSLEICPQFMKDFNRSHFYVNGECLFKGTEANKQIEDYQAAFFRRLYDLAGDTQAITNISILAVQSIGGDVLKSIGGETVNRDRSGVTSLNPTNESHQVFDIKIKNGTLVLASRMIIKIREYDQKSPKANEILGYTIATREIILSEKALKTDWRKSQSYFSLNTYFGSSIDTLGPEDLQLKDSFSKLYKDADEATMEFAKLVKS